MRFLPEIQMIVQYALATQHVLATPVKPPRTPINPPHTPMKHQLKSVYEQYEHDDTMKLRATRVAQEFEDAR